MWLKISSLLTNLKTFQKFYWKQIHDHFVTNCLNFGNSFIVVLVRVDDGLEFFMDQAGITLKYGNHSWPMISSLLKNLKTFQKLLGSSEVLISADHNLLNFGAMLI